MQQRLGYKIIAARKATKHAASMVSPKSRIGHWSTTEERHGGVVLARGPGEVGQSDHLSEREDQEVRREGRLGRR